jgi:osmotically-inducible protein OsmY
MKYFQMLLLSAMSFSLSGCLPTIFTTAASSTMAIAKDDRTIGIALDDTKISNKLRLDLIQKGFKNLYSKINFDVERGRILYTGFVETEEDMINAVDIAWQQEGVKEVINELKVDPKSRNFDIVQYTKDSVITAQLKSKLLMNRDIKFVNYTIVTNENVVYLFGIARSEEELEKVADIASKIRGVEKVVTYVNLRQENSKDIEKSQ